MNLSKMNVLVEATRLAIHNTENNATVKRQMAAYGLSPAELQTGKNRLRTLEQEHERQVQLQDERWSLARQMEASLQAVVSTFKTHVRLARSAFRNDPDLLHSLRAERFDARPWECVQQAVHFYRVFAARQLSLENLGVSAKEIQQAQRAVTELQRMKEARADKKGLAGPPWPSRAPSPGSKRRKNYVRGWSTFELSPASPSASNPRCWSASA